jgi:CO/xanthine dehydrogenase Mo-binding subunit
VSLRRYVAVDDAGRVVNPLLAEGQRHGGIAGHRAGLFEGVRQIDMPLTPWRVWKAIEDSRLGGSTPL